MGPNGQIIVACTTKTGFSFVIERQKQFLPGTALGSSCANSNLQTRHCNPLDSFRGGPPDGLCKPPLIIFHVMTPQNQNPRTRTPEPARRRRLSDISIRPFATIGPGTAAVLGSCKYSRYPCGNCNATTVSAADPSDRNWGSSDI